MLFASETPVQSGHIPFHMLGHMLGHTLLHVGTSPGVMLLPCSANCTSSVNAAAQQHQAASSVLKWCEV